MTASRSSGRWMRYGWPGNVRELENEIVQRAIVRSQGGAGVRFDVNLLSTGLSSVTSDASCAPGCRLGSLERRLVQDALAGEPCMGIEPAHGAGAGVVASRVSTAS